MARYLLFTALLVSFFNLGCASTAQNPANDSADIMSDNVYEAIIGRNTAKTDQYSGFYQTFQADITILNSEVQNAVLKRKAGFLQWDDGQLRSEQEKAQQEAAAYSKFFMRFYTPDNEYDDFHKGKTIWRVYLEYGGSRFEGKVSKVSDKFVEVKNTFPHFNRFSTPYEISFNIPMNTIENGSSKVILTSSLGSAEFKFPVGK